MTDISIDDMITARTEARPDFKKGGQPITPFKNKEDLEAEGMDAMNAAIGAAKNKKAAFKGDSLDNALNQSNNEYYRDGDPYFGETLPMNEIGAQRPRSKHVGAILVDDGGYYTEDGEGPFKDVDDTEYAVHDDTNRLTDRAKLTAKEAAPLKETADKLREEKKIEEEREAKLEDILTPEILEGYKAKTLPKELQDAIQSLYDNYAIVKSATAEFSKAEDSETAITEDAVAESAGAPCAEDAEPKHGKGIDALIAERQ